jgi:hypothetical protein
MKQLLIILTVVGLVFAQEADKLEQEGRFEITPEMKEKIEAAKAIHEEMMEKFEALPKEEKKDYFEDILEETIGDSEDIFLEMTPEQKARIEAKITEIQAKYKNNKEMMKGFDGKDFMYEDFMEGMIGPQDELIEELEIPFHDLHIEEMKEIHDNQMEEIKIPGDELTEEYQAIFQDQMEEMKDNSEALKEDNR